MDSRCSLREQSVGLGKHGVDSINSSLHEQNNRMQWNHETNDAQSTKGWNYVIRMYQARQEIIDGQWKFPDPVPVK